MSQSVETPASTGPVPSGRGSDGSKRAVRSTPSASAILFNELVLAHFRWFALHGRYGEFGGLTGSARSCGMATQSAADRRGQSSAAEADYREKLEQFIESEGDIVAAYWSTTVPSGIVMTMRPRRVRDLLLRPTISLHRTTTWLTASDPQVAELLHHCDSLGNKAAQILTHTPKRVAMTWIFSTQSYLLGVVEGRSWGPYLWRERDQRPPRVEDGRCPCGTDQREPAGTQVAEEPVLTGTPTEPADEQTDHDLVARGRTEIIEIEKYYDRAAANAARFLYFWGMLAGALVATVAGVLVALILGSGFAVIDLGSTSTRFFFACYSAGALGAIVSVLTRMRSDHFALDYEVGRMPAFWLGTFRPFLGAVFGLFIYFALQSKLLQVQQPDEGKAFFFFTLFAFVAGFSERLTHVILGGAERTVAGTLETGGQGGRRDIHDDYHRRCERE